MPISIDSLAEVALDYTNRGPGLAAGFQQLEGHLAETREGYLLVNVTVTGAVVPVVMARSDLYVLGFRCAGTWYRFDDAAWPFTQAATTLGYTGQYAALGGLTGNLTEGSITGIGRLTNPAMRSQWRDPLRTLLVVVAEAARLIPVRMQILGLLNGILHTQTVPLAPLAVYIQNWDRASRGADMSRPNGANGRVGFNDPTIIKR